MSHFSGRVHANRGRISNPECEGCGAEARAAAPSHLEIARLAYSYWESRGRQGGSPMEDWLRAERELRGRAE